MKEAAVLNSVNCYRPVTIKFLLLRAITTISSFQVWLLKLWFYPFFRFLIDDHVLWNSLLIKSRHQSTVGQSCMQFCLIAKILKLGF